jgi:uncharacterized protein HemX
MLLRVSCIVVVLGVCLAGCTEMRPDEVTDHSTLVRSYDGTLTRSEKSQVIRELKEDTAKQRKEVSQDDGETSGTPPKKQD